ncbi:recombinase family protein [Plantactinospora sonchi]|uniref:Recombinase family protein n=1 Tax=Plantactinospora sonchi TaxID=1544735 RepID=A0ABU7RX18_9ACTN
MTEKPRRRAAKYRRISDDREGRELGVQRQDEDLDTLGERLNLEFVADYVDNDISASTKSRKVRPDYKRMLADARSGEFEVIAAYTSGRLTRRPREHEDLIDLAVDHGIEFVYVRSPSFDLNTSAGRRIARILAANDAGESEDIAERVSREARQRAERGLISGGGTRPFGYEADRKTVRELEAELIRDAAHRILDGLATVTGMCREWNDKGIRTVTGALWTKHVLRRILMSARISGRREHKGVIVATAEWDKIIEPEESDRLRELLGDPARATYDGNSARKYLLTGFLYCGVPGCGDKLIARPQSDHQRSYVCATIGRSHLRMIAEPLELYVREAAFDYLSEFVHLAAAVAPDASEGTQEAELWQELVNYQRRLEKLEEDFYVHERMPEARYRRLAAALETEIDKTRDRLTRTRAKSAIRNLPTSEARAREMWEERGLEWRRLFLGALVERVTIGPAIRGLNRFDPTRVRIKWRKPG